MSLRSVAPGIAWMLLAVALALSVPACQRGEIGQTSDGPSTEELIAFYSPRSIKIQPFTKPRSFDSDAVPDGIAVSLRTLDAAGDPVKAYGVFIFELYAYRSALGDRKGQLIQSWTQPVLNTRDQKQFWERITSSYEFQLSWEGRPIAPQQKYILVASFQAPGSERLFDQYEFEFRVVREEILNALTTEP